MMEGGSEVIEAKPVPETPEEPAQPADEAGEAVQPARLDEVELQRLREQARQEGYEHGLEEGRQAGEQQRERIIEQAHAQALEEAHTRFSGYLQAFHERLEDLEGELCEATTSLALELARQVIRFEVSLRPEKLSEVIQAALLEAPIGRTTPVIRAHPQSINELEALERGCGCELRADESIEPGGCFISLVDDVEGGTDWSGARVGEIDLTLQSRWRECIQRMLGHDHNSETSTET